MERISGGEPSSLGKRKVPKGMGVGFPSFRHLCDFGCEQEATFYFKSSKKWCCSASPNSCNGKRAKDSQLKKGKNPFEGREHPRPFLGKSTWNKGLCVDDLPPDVQEKYRAGGRASMAKLHSDQAFRDNNAQRARESAISRKLGGITRGGGRGKKGWYKGFYFDSSWELAFIVYCLDHDIPIMRNKQKFPYIFEEKTRSYYPDFIIENKFYEIKGYITAQVQAKIDQFPLPLVVITKKEMEKYLMYTRTKYGKDFVHVLKELQ